MKLLEITLSLLAPYDCLICGLEGSVLCGACTHNHLQPFGERCAGCNALSANSKTCTNCRAGGLPAHIWVAEVYRGAANRLVYKYKFDHWRGVSEFLAKQVVYAVGDASVDFIVPVPTATRRVRERGFDHSRLLAKEVAQRMGVPCADVLGRVGQKTQVGASRQDRIAQSLNEYYLRDKRAIVGSKILLVDDVMTTGATLAACASILRKAGARSVDATVFAKKT